MESYDYSIELLNTAKLRMVNEESKFVAVKGHLDAYHEAIQLALRVYRETGEERFLEKAFRYAESSKSFALLSEIRNNEVMEFAGLPSQVKNEEERLSREITAYEELLFSEQLKEYPDSLKLTNFSNKLFNLRDDYNNLLYEIENNYPNYYELKYNPHFTTLKEIRNNIGRREALVEYVLSDTLLTMFIIDEKGVDVVHQPVEPSFSGECIEYYRLIHTQDFNNHAHDTYRRYVELGRKFHRVLVEPALAHTEETTVTFVPDGALMYLPFESFLTADTDAEYINYRDLPYLIHDLSVGYTYSSTLLFSERMQSEPTKDKVLAFAPTYANLFDFEEPLVWNRQSNPDFLIPLKGVKEEVRNISQRVPARVFMDYQATENNFKKHAPGYSIIHLAMHTIMNDEHPMYSRLAFTRTEEDTTQDDDLFTYEIYNMRLNARMIVLSSCSSGYGKMLKGEGMMSLARGFFYAGCPSIIMTLWQVSDRSSAELMNGFYKYLKKGKSKHEALRLAKIDYIRESDGLKTNPYFWSAFICVGDNSPVYSRSGLIWWILVVAAFAGSIIYIQVRTSRKKKNSSQH